jgi:hypothetical protein
LSHSTAPSFKVFFWVGSLFRVKKIAKFIRKGIHFQYTETGLSLEWEDHGSFIN